MKPWFVVVLCVIAWAKVARAGRLECDLAGSGATAAKVVAEETGGLRVAILHADGRREELYDGTSICGRALNAFPFPAECEEKFSLAYPQKHLRILCQEPAGAAPRRWAATLKLSFSPSFESGSLACETRNESVRKLALTNCHEEW